MKPETQQLGWPMMSRMWAVLQGVNAEVEPELDELGLHVKQFFLMAGLANGASPGDLGRLMSVPPSTITYLVKPLEARGFVSRKIASGDLRQVVLSLTPSGRKATAKAEEILSRTFSARLSALTGEEIAQLNSILDKMNAQPKKL